MSRSVLALLLIAAGLVLYLKLVEMPTEQKRTASESAARKLLDFKDEDIQAFTLTSLQGEMELIREPDGRWLIRKPNAVGTGGASSGPPPAGMEADAAAVDEFLRTLLLAEVSRVVDESGADLEGYGLAAPSLTVSFHLTSGARTIRLGDSEPLSATLYALREGAPKVLLTTLSGRDVLAKNIREFRRRRVFQFDRNQVTRLKVATARETVVLYKDGHGDKETWTIKSPAETPADQPEVKSLLLGLQDLRAQDFLDDPTDRAATRARLGRPLATFTLREGAADRTLSLFIDPRDKRLAYAESAPHDPLYRITPAVAQDLAKGLFALRNKQLIAAEPDRVKTLVVKRGGLEFSLTREGGGWLVDGDPALQADAARINMFVTRVVRIQAERIVAEKPADLKSYGLAPPRIELIAADAQGKLAGRIAFGREEQSLAYAMGTAMPGVFQVRPDILKDIPGRDELISGKTGR
ncbi:MAG: DUF4340 domain-containing protein [Nitrospirae bacterium]|nr:MAG: DUF4340 domain-containing protein [Nitrospirota bacterium]